MFNQKPKTMKIYKTIAEIKADNKAKGRYFFSRNTMKFFNSKIHPYVYRGVYFITQETGPDDITRYSVRMVLNGVIETLGRFHSFQTRQEARNFIEELPEQFPQAYKACVDQFNKKDKTFNCVELGLIEPANNKGKYYKDSFLGAISWILDNSVKLGQPFLTEYSEQFYNRLRELKVKAVQA